MARKMLLLKLAAGFPAPSDPAEQKELAQVEASLDGDYGRGKWCPRRRKRSKCLDVTAVGKLMAESRDEAELKRAWIGWHAVGAPMRQRYTRMVELGDKGARELGFADAGALWRSNYDMPPDDFAKEVDRLWDQLRPLYLSLHAYVRGQLAKKYGNDVVPAQRTDSRASARQYLGAGVEQRLSADGFAQACAKLRPHENPAGSPHRCTRHGRITAKVSSRRSALRRCRKHFGSARCSPSPPTATSFATPAPGTSIRKTISASRCAFRSRRKTFVTIHHELGHNFYQRAYNTQPPLFQNSANDGFHEAVGDTIALSVTPEYLKKLGLIDTVPPASRRYRLPACSRLSKKSHFSRSA